MKAWIARDDDGAIAIFAKKPILVEDEEDGEKFSYFTADEDDVLFLETLMDKDFHVEVTMENSPKRIELTDQDLLSILRRALEENYAHLEKRHAQTGGFMDLTEVALAMGKAYPLNHLIGLIEASINCEKGGEE